jgi:gallate decarboxylase subunit D
LSCFISFIRRLALSKSKKVFNKIQTAVMEFTTGTQTGVYDLTASVRLIGRDLLVAIWGGEKPHIGAVAVAQPRPSLKDPDVNSATASVICYAGHKEDELVKASAEIIAAVMNTRVVVTGGIHWDNLEQDGINTILKNGNALVEMILEQCLAEFPSFKK